MFLIFRALVMTLTTQGFFEKCMMYIKFLFHEPSNYANKLYYHSRCWDPIVKYVDEKFQQFLHDETRVNRIGNKTKQFLCKIPWKWYIFRWDTKWRQSACIAVLYIPHRPWTQVSLEIITCNTVTNHIFKKFKDLVLVKKKSMLVLSKPLVSTLYILVTFPF